MDLYERQQFDFLLQSAVNRFAERLEERMRGAAAAYQQLASDAGNTDTNEFTEAIFQDFLLDNIDGACFVLRAIPQKRIGRQLIDSETTLQNCLLQIAKQQFAQLLKSKTVEALEQHASYQTSTSGD